jgi:ABC-2 type transport system ATP-binding protein
VTRKPLQAKRITGYLPDGVGFYGNLTNKQNLKYFSKFYGMKDADANKRIDELLEYVGLKGVDKPVAGYSRGMKQRLGLAQALLNDPKAIFLDEPTNGLDPQGVIQFRNIIKDVAAQGKTVFFSSHILDEVQHVCTKIGIITKGKLIASGTPDEVKGLMGGQEYVTIHVKVKGSMPKLEDVRIIDAIYHNGSAVIKAKTDIREDISQTLFNQSILIKELKVEEKTLEDIFLDSVYRSG